MAKGRINKRSGVYHRNKDATLSEGILTGEKILTTKDQSSEERLLQLVDDYISGRFTIQSEEALIQEIINLISPTLSSDDVFEVLFGGGGVMVESPEEGVAALRTYVQSKNKR